MTILTMPLAFPGLPILPSLSDFVGQIVTTDTYLPLENIQGDIL